MNGVILAGFSAAEMIVLLCVFTGSPVQLAYALAGVMGLTTLMALCMRAGEALPARSELRCGAMLGWLAVYAVQLFISYYAYFIPAWDVRTILESAYAIAGGEGLIDHYYFSLYGNNVLMTLFFAAVIKGFRLVAGNPGLDRCVLVLIAVNCLMHTLTCMLTVHTVKRMTDSRAMARVSLVVSVAYIALTPRILIPYSDSLGLIFPVLMLAMYERARRGTRPFAWWLAISACAGVAFLVKPQPFVAAIAIVMVECGRLLREGEAGKMTARLGVFAMIVAMIVGPVSDVMTGLSPIERREQLDVGAMHFLMMGLNEETTGMYSAEDLTYSLTYPTKQERRRAQLQEIGRRLEAMGPDGLAAHLVKKTRLVFGHGMFNYDEDTNGRTEIADKDGFFSPLLKGLTRPGGKGFSALMAASQALWMGLVTCSLFSIAAFRRSEPGVQRDMFCVMLLSLLGLTAFEWMFETRARYLFTMVPLYVIVGTVGLHAVLFRVRERC